jgi:hypothetical protein
MAGPLNTGQQIMTDLFIQLLPVTIYVLCHLAYPTKNLVMMIHKTAPCASRENFASFNIKESRDTRNLSENCKTKPKIKRFELTSSRLFLPPLRLVVALSLFSDVSWVPPSGTPPTWLYKVNQRFKQLHRQSDLILTLTLSG